MGELNCPENGFAMVAVVVVESVLLKNGVFFREEN